MSAAISGGHVRIRDTSVKKYASFYGLPITDDVLFEVVYIDGGSGRDALHLSNRERRARALAALAETWRPA